MYVWTQVYIYMIHRSDGRWRVHRTPTSARVGASVTFSDTVQVKGAVGNTRKEKDKKKDDRHTVRFGFIPPRGPVNFPSSQESFQAAKRPSVNFPCGQKTFRQLPSLYREAGRPSVNLRQLLCGWEYSGSLLCEVNGQQDN